MKHLTDDEIQSSLHTLPSNERARIEDHLNDCSGCQEKLLLYSKLGDVVVSASSNPVPKGFEMAVMYGVRRARRVLRIADLIVTVVIITGLALVGSVIFLTPQLRHGFARYLMDAWQYASELTTAFEGSSDAVVILAFGVVLLVLFGVVDRWTIGRLRLATLAGECSETN